MRPFRVEAPAGALVPVAELRKHVRMDTNEEDGLLAGFERAAVDYLDGYSGRLGRCILRQKWALPLLGKPEIVALPFPDCRDFKIERLDAGNWSVVDITVLQHFEDQVALGEMPSDWTGLHLTFIAGWDNPDLVPANIEQAVRMLAAHWFDNRSAVSSGGAPHEVPMSVEALIAPLINVFV